MDTDELKWLGEAPLMAAYRVGHNGKSAAQIGLAVALARGAGKPATSAVRTTATMAAAAAAKPKASTSKPRDRVKVVAHAVANDPALKGKAALALDMLADDDCANVSANGIVKLLKAGASASPQTAEDVARARDNAMRAEMRKAIGTSGNSAIAADGGSIDNAAKAGSTWAKSIAKINRLNGFN